jgi:hypothetical protein
MTTDDTTPTDNIIGFNKRFTTPPPAPAPTWNIIYRMDDKEGTIDNRQVTGYLFSMMPTFMIASKEKVETVNESIFGIPYERLVCYERDLTKE